MQKWMDRPPTYQETMSVSMRLDQQLDKLATLPRAAWKRLVHDVQV
jgi:hypothetical protein